MNEQTEHLLDPSSDGDPASEGERWERLLNTDESKKINMVERTWSQLLEIGYDPIKSRLKVEKPLGNNQVC